MVFTYPQIQAERSARTAGGKIVLHSSYRACNILPKALLTGSGGDLGFREVIYPIDFSYNHRNFYS
ncbi:hypothetical protein SAMN05443144_104199 [Fodinibius roseus]|uniref:Uncharacterized protein n=1 Tax=Fodinibius roseus TaxID=1194090 RepID=A0A1M4XRK2_9BACT|nr:hypothetical protein SAMN05443144_104199 [Fodinibius roseus]